MDEDDETAFLLILKIYAFSRRSATDTPPPFLEDGTVLLDQRIVSSLSSVEECSIWLAVFPPQRWPLLFYRGEGLFTPFPPRARPMFLSPPVKPFPSLICYAFCVLFFSIASVGTIICLLPFPPEML